MQLVVILCAQFGFCLDEEFMSAACDRGIIYGKPRTLAPSPTTRSPDDPEAPPSTKSLTLDVDRHKL
jgi:hypothetical protein